MLRRGLLVGVSSVFGARALAQVMRPGPGLMSSGQVFSAWNPADKAIGITLSNSNRGWTGATVGNSVRNTKPQASGKLYFEQTFTSGTGGPRIGVARSSASLTQAPGENVNSYGYTPGGALRYSAANEWTGGASVGVGAVVGIALDLTNRKIYVAVNGSWQNGGNPSAGTGGTTLAGAFGGDIFIIAGVNSATPLATLNVGNNAFAYSIPSGYSAWG